MLFWGTGIVLALVFWLAPDRLDLVLPESYQETYAEEDFVSYYSENPSIVFFSGVTTNNIQVSVLAYALGALAVFPGALILFEQRRLPRAWWPGSSSSGASSGRCSWCTSSRTGCWS